MRVSWRLTLGVLLVGVWPHLGCLHPQADHAVQDERANPKSTTAKKDAPPPQPALTPTAQAAELERAGKYREAIALYEKMRAPGSPDALLATKLLAGLYFRQGDMERAEQEYRALHEKNRTDAAVLTSLGDISCRRAHWGIAEGLYAEALRHQPENASAHSGLGMALAQQAAVAKSAEEFKSRYARSVEEFKKVLKSDADAHCEVAWVMKMRGKDHEALQAYQTALKLEPANARARNEVAALRQKGVATDPPTTIVRMTTPTDKRGVAEFHPATASQAASDGMNRLQMQRYILPPLPDDLSTGSETPGQQK
jgi:tetratricopeptide (TPR) repeat protein